MQRVGEGWGVPLRRSAASNPQPHRAHPGLSPGSGGLGPGSEEACAQATRPAHAPRAALEVEGGYEAGDWVGLSPGTGPPPWASRAHCPSRSHTRRIQIPGHCGAGRQLAGDPVQMRHLCPWDDAPPHPQGRTCQLGVTLSYVGGGTRGPSRHRPCWHLPRWCHSLSPAPPPSGREEAGVGTACGWGGLSPRHPLRQHLQPWVPSPLPGR